MAAAQATRQRWTFTTPSRSHPLIARAGLPKGRPCRLPPDFGAAALCASAEHGNSSFAKPDDAIVLVGPSDAALPA